jgi:aminoglycoside phosphotransferase (APT) family kinase protein
MTANRRIGRGETAELIAVDGDRVAKRFRQGFDAEVARREAANARLAREAGLPVPRVHSVTVSNGRPTIVYERVDGPTMRSRLCRPPGPRRHARRLAALQATVHSVEPGPTELPATRERLAGEIDRVPGLPAADGRRILSVLDGLPAGRALCHGDLHPGNVLLADRGPVVIDWLDAGRGHPAADVARTSLLLRYGGAPGLATSAVRRAVQRWYLDAYCGRTDVDRKQVRAWELPVATARLNEGVPEESRLRTLVDARRGEIDGR